MAVEYISVSSTARFCGVSPNSGYALCDKVWMREVDRQMEVRSQAAAKKR